MESEAVEPRRLVEHEQTPTLDVDSCVFTWKEEWSAAEGNYSPPSGWTDEDDDHVDPDLEQDFYRQIRESDGFDVDIRIPNTSINVVKCAKNDDCRGDMLGICARVGLHWYNFHKAIDPANHDARVTFQTSVTRATCKNDEDLRIQTDVCRIKPKIQGTGDKIERWDYEAVDAFYKGNLPEWISNDDALMQSSERYQFYEVQESEIRQHSWLNLYAEIASYSLWEGNTTRLESCVPLQIKSVVVRTRQDLKSKQKLMAGNAIFYISFRDFNAPHGPPQDHRAIVRRTVDGIPGHVCLEFKCWLEDL